MVPVYFVFVRLQFCEKLETDKVSDQSEISSYSHGLEVILASDADEGKTWHQVAVPGYDKIDIKVNAVS